jgi:ATP/maltotriose-dependent transcriptional regulator MalT
MMARVLAVLGVGVWCFLILFASLGMIIDRGLADVGIAWVGVLGIGVAAPVLLLWQINRAITAHETSRRALPNERGREKELLAALEERGGITPVTAAISTSLTAEEASKMLEKLTTKGYLHLRIEDGIPTYALAGRTTHELPQPSSESIVRSADVTPAPPPVDLSERELEVLTLLASGRTNSEIAGDLFIAIGTVKSHVNNIYTKLEVRNRAEAVTRARQLELLR